MPSMSTDRSLPLRERKKLRTHRALADAALRMFAAQGFDRTTLEEVAEAAEVSKSTFFRFFPAKEAAAIDAEAEGWAASIRAGTSASWLLAIWWRPSRLCSPTSSTTARASRTR